MANAPTAVSSSAPATIAVPLLDLKAQYATIRSEIEPVVKDVIESQYFIGGPQIEALEKEVAEYSRAKHAIGCANGSDAIVLALQALGIGPGDEVVIPTYTFFATAGSVSRLGAKPVFADIDPVTYNLCPESLRRAIGRCRKLRALIPVHLFGQAADLDSILAIASEQRVPVIEDAAQAIGSEDTGGRRIGSRGAIVTFSFFPSKNLGGFGDGGMVTTNDSSLAERLRRLRNHGMEPRYYHDEIGMNSRLDALQAAVLRVKLRHLDAWTQARQSNAAWYDRALGESGAKSSREPVDSGGLAIRTPQPAPHGARHIYNQYVVRVPQKIRDKVREELTARKIGTEIYYPLPLHLQKCFAFIGDGPGSHPHSERAAKETIALPIYGELTEAQRRHVVDSLVDAVKRLA
ncbi:MAG: DegT/DnrJ/EryC1/StrS family aminotransferase [Phycisphaerae bacterium]|nr:DegT/DnrJ/EryC1/StrS family aminotransferase [Phycisphaerae bacterium]